MKTGQLGGGGAWVWVWILVLKIVEGFLDGAMRSLDLIFLEGSRIDFDVDGHRGYG